jgi:hypothetical protein
MMHTTVSGTHPTEELPISKKRHQHRIPSINPLCLNRSNQIRKPDDACESPSQLPMNAPDTVRILSPIQKGKGRPIRPHRREIGPSPHIYLIRIQNPMIWVRYPWLGIETQRKKGREGLWV